MAEISKKLTVLSQIAKELNRRQITWAIGASLLLYLKGMVQEFHDIDIMVAEADAEKAKKVLLSFGKLLPAGPKGQYKTKYFWEFDVDGVDIDMMAGFTIVHDGMDFYFPLEKEQINDYTEINGAVIPLQSLDEWRIYYKLMGRTDKIAIMDR
ncbi:nucleotidyltransferase domain-containing protein [Caproiciproducens galactitolivorans]|uniref:LicD family protein n=1 Tax=Caproiciproducens galactitolivorans TaxID=642589 RepID=A0ABT4BXN0_9FIRM|nr:hypothetical protein [Caproiciproducens galactitolivorans]MCY1714703.1 hypothetical protein [Caproiciproducens galactitolivorans]